MVLVASNLRSKSGPAIRGRMLPVPTTAFQIPGFESLTAVTYPRGNYSETWKILGGDANTTFEQAAGAQDLPQPGSTNSTGNFVVASLEPSKTDSETAWYVTVNYEQNPLRMPLEMHVQTTHRVVDRSYYWDYTDKLKPQKKPIRNAAGDMWTRGITDEEASVRIELVKRVSFFNHGWPAMYCDRQNLKQFMGFAVGTVYCADIRAVLAYDPLTHYLMTGTFEIRMEGWKHRRVQIGETYYVSDSNFPSGKKRVTWRTDQGDVTCLPVLLDKDGFKLAEGAEPIEATYDTVPYADFNALPFFSA